MIDAVQTFLSHRFGLSLLALAVVVAGLLAAWLSRSGSGRSPRHIIVAAATPMPVVLAIVTAVTLAFAPWDDPLIRAVLLTVGLLGTIFSLLLGLVAAALVVRWASR